MKNKYDRIKAEKNKERRIYEEIVNIKMKEQREGCHEKSGSIVEMI